MSKAFDCATPLTAELVRQFIKDGYTAVCRYLAPKGSWKRLTGTEAIVISLAGLWIVSVFEQGAGNARGGATQGDEDGQLAFLFAREVGQPEGTPIYFAVDFDATPANYDAIEAYLRAADAQIPSYECAVYGEEEVCREMLRRGVVKRVWQTYAWSHGKKVDNPNIYQFDNGPDGNGMTVHGIGVDLDETNGDAGGWKIGMYVKSEPTLSVDDANVIIETWIKPDWDNAEAKKSGESSETVDALTKQQEYYHYLGNALRRASGQPEQ